MVGGRLAYRVFGRLPFGAKLVANRLLNTTFLVGMLAVVRNPEGEVLILRHTYRPEREYGVPSGWLKAGEPLPDAMRREIVEETGFDVEFVRVLSIESCRRPTRLDVWLEFSFRRGTFEPSAEVFDAAFYALDALPPVSRVQREFLSALPPAPSRR